MGESTRAATFRSRLALVWVVAVVATVLAGLTVPGGFASGNPPDVVESDAAVEPAPTVEQAAEIDVEAFTSVSGPGGPWNNAPRPETAAGSKVWLRVRVANPGAAPLNGFEIVVSSLSSDKVDYQGALEAALGGEGCPSPAGTSLAPGATWECVFGPFRALEGVHEHRVSVTAGGAGDRDPAGYVGTAQEPAPPREPPPVAPTPEPPPADSPESPPVAAPPAEAPETPAAPPPPAAPPATGHPDAALHLAKQVSVSGPSGPWDDADDPTGPEVVAGASVHFRLVVTNTGGAAVENLTLTDPGLQTALDSQCSLPALLGPGDGFSCVIGPDAAVEGQHVNTATVAGEVAGTRQVFPRDFPIFPSLTGKGAQYIFVFEDGTVVRGSSQPGGNGFTGRQYEPDFNPALAALGVPWRLSETVHVSCSDSFPGGWGSVSSPVRGVDPFRVTSFSIARFKKGVIQKSCGSGVVIEPQTVSDTDRAHYLGVARPPAAIGDRVWADANGNGRQDGGEPGVPGVNVELLDDARQATGRSTTTDGAGGYRFDDVEPDVDHFVRFTRPDGFLFTVPNQGDDAGDSDASVFTGISDRVAPAPGEFDDSVDAGLFACPVTGTHVVDLTGTRLLDSSPTSTGRRYLEVPAGVYRVTLVGADFFEGHATQGQQFEQYFVVLYDGAGNVVYESPAISDLPESEHFLVETVDTAAVIAATVQAFEGLHVGVRIGNQPTANSIDPVCVVLDEVAAPAAVRIVKLTNGEDANDPPGPQVTVGTAVTWRYEVSNPGTLALAAVAVTDDRGVTPALVSGDDGDGLLEPGEVWVYEAAGTAVAGQYRNVGTVTAQPVDGAGTPVGPPVADDDPSHYLGVAAPAAAIDVEKFTSPAAVPGRGDDADVAPGPSITVGEQVRWTYEVSNPGDVPLSDIIVFDDQGEVPVYVQGDDNGSGMLDPGEVYVFEATNAAVAGQYRNVTMAVATPRLADGTPLPVVSDEDPSHYLGVGAPAAAIDVEKFTSPAAVPGRGDDADVAPGPSITVGEQVRWTYEVSNPGDVPLSDIIVFDDQGEVPVYVEGDDNGSGMLDPGEVYVFEATNAAVAGQYRNVTRAVATPRLADGTPLPMVEDSDPSHYFGEGVPATGIVVEKSTSPAAVPGRGDDADDAPGPFLPAGEQVRWTYLVSNPGDVPLSDIIVFDDQGEVPVYVQGDDNGSGMLDPGEVYVFEATNGAVAGQYRNVTRAVATPRLADGTPLPVVEDTDPSHYFGAVGGIRIVKLTNGDDANAAPGPEITQGAAVVWTYRVSNTGNVSLAAVTVGDDQGVTPVLVSGDDGDGLLEVGEVWVFEATGTAVLGQYRNMGTAAGQPVEPGGAAVGPPVSDDDPSHYFGVPGPPG